MPREVHSTSFARPRRIVHEGGFTLDIQARYIQFPTNVSYTIITSELLDAMGRLEQLPTPCPAEEASTDDTDLSRYFRYMEFQLDVSHSDLQISVQVIEVSTLEARPAAHPQTYLSTEIEDVYCVYTESRVNALRLIDLYHQAENPAGLFRDAAAS
ncbi:hypothetical protein H4R34_002592 [Dimargaris verticillata]|uniref:Uncharacterized protein n=1 Tax=Dimargaris verticillata TaxID=2761393 RepID=A0A9W8E950_9FUNG|nr:hypothetical protein H4R34_002592 [Dimargaris verticillata]